MTWDVGFSVDILHRDTNTLWVKQTGVGQPHPYLANTNLTEQALRPDR